MMVKYVSEIKCPLGFMFYESQPSLTEKMSNPGGTFRPHNRATMNFLKKIHKGYDEISIVIA